MIKKPSHHIFALGFILVIATLQVKSQPEAVSELLFDPAPTDKQGRFTNYQTDLSHGSLAVRVPFFYAALAQYFAVMPVHQSKLLMMVAFYAITPRFPPLPGLVMPPSWCRWMELTS